MKSVFVIYHKGCLDGKSGAWVAWKKFGANATYIAGTYQTPPADIRDSVIYMIDFSYPAEVVATLVKDGNEVIIIDHHKTAAEAAKIATESRFDLNHSGCTLAWNYFFPSEPLPQLLALVEDNDLWTSAYPETMPITAMLETYQFSFELWDSLVKKIETSKIRKHIVQDGKKLLAKYAEVRRKLIAKAPLVRFEGHITKAANVFLPDLQKGLLGQDIYKTYDFAILWSQKSNDIIRVSLRSNGKVDVSELAKKYGGGGHAQAAGFTIPAAKGVPWEIVEE